VDYFESYYHYDTPIGADGTPYDYYEAFRDWVVANDKQVGWSEKEGGFWVVAGYEAAKEIYQNPGALTNRESTFPVYNTPDGRALMLAAYDEPEHSKYRKLVSGPFSPKSAAAMEGQLRDTANDLIDGWIEDGHVDIVAGLANEVPARATAILLGLPPDQGDVYRTWTYAMAQQQHTDPEVAAIKLGEMDDWFAELLEERKRNPGEDVLSGVIQAEVDGEKLTDQEVHDFFVVLLLGGIDNTTKLLSNFAWRLAWDRELRRRLIRHAELMPTAVDECLRYYSPAMTVRVVGDEPVTVHGCKMQPGQFVVKALPILNRDSREFPNPDVFVPDRAPNRHLALGMGIHRCLGAHLLKIEARVAMTELLRRIPEFELDHNIGTQWLLGQVGGMERVPIVFPPGGTVDPERDVAERPVSHV
jgi:cytochrome P450